MIKSMTGFAKSEATENDITAVVEIRSLNGRYLDINCRMPRDVSHRERDIRDTVKSYLNRGSVTVYVSLEFDGSAKPSVINEKAAIKCYDDLNSLRQKMKIKDAVKLEHVLSFSDSFLQEDKDVDADKVYAIVSKVLRNSLKSLDVMCIKEGQQIAKDIKMRIGLVEESMQQIREISIRRVPEERQKLRERIALLFETDEIDEQRLQTEMVLLSDKLDVTEETVRMESHLKFFNEIFKEKESSGRKLNFLLQEMNREINTVGSKISDAEAAKIVVAVKEEIEKIREQVQNIA